MQLISNPLAYWSALVIISAGLGVLLGYLSHVVTKVWGLMILPQFEAIALQFVILSIAMKLFPQDWVLSAVVSVAAFVVTIWWFTKGRNNSKKFKRAANRFLRKLLEKIEEALAPPAPELIPIRVRR